ncbi:DUF4019 domain-containing protein [Nitrosomonas sp. JL21]|uniref:DUF4019 domain-containing protein n=1 Tax=Nitrosomonas sp. JL21 TaxID=153949 RepID=UPI001368BD31|nr:DUF4019 domain-containing protein [Nitrosomonas sp. JL21]MBL8498705.1 DUF4019 domain-containing protein [Nitrosomonas sp.]MCC7091604.1 DUF4019 domain-containing protein [Nitrosomonas sp.]MXS77460.1 DUF4019 domain-containing protein [Nitrosomonas sp. JL21]
MIKKLWLLGWLLICATVVYADDKAILAQVERSARDWLARVDAGNYPESWEQAAPLLKSKINQAEWVKSTTAVRATRGEMTARYIATAGTTTSLSGFPDGEYIVLQFYTTFAPQSLALETITLTKASGETWQVIDYAMK